MDKTHKEELKDWIKNDPHLQKWWEEEFTKADADMDPVLRDRMFARVKEQTVGTSKGLRGNLRINLWKWAAVICLPLCIAFFAYYLIDASRTPGTPFVVNAGKGDKATIELPDGTTVVLNSASRLSYLNDYGRKTRRVRLDGEAYFKVARDEARTFIVQAGDLEVKVLGTSFNVSAYEDDEEVIVVLLEGKVGVYTPQASRIMQPGEKLEYNKLSHRLSTAKVNSDDYVQWTKGNFYFEKESMADIMKALSRIYNVEIRIESDRLLREHFTGTIPGSGIQNALSILMLAADFTYEMDGTVIVVKEKGN